MTSFTILCNIEIDNSIPDGQMQFSSSFKDEFLGSNKNIDSLWSASNDTRYTIRCNLDMYDKVVERLAPNVVPFGPV